MISDQRGNTRVSCFQAGDVYRDPNREKLGRMIIKDVSYSGICIETLVALSVSEIIYLDFEIAGRFFFPKVPAMVTRIQRQPGGILSGLNFQKGEDRRKIRQALTYLIENSQ